MTDDLHELRTPLGLVIGFSELLARPEPLADAERLEYAQRLHRAALELRDLLNVRQAQP